MFDLHPLTLWGIIVLALGSIVGTILIQRGNALKSKESSQVTQSRLIELKEQNKLIESQNEHFKSLVEEQKQVLDVQSSLLKQQLTFSKNSEYMNFWASFNEYQVISHELLDVSYYIYKSSFGKTEFLRLPRNQIEEIEKNINKAIANLRKTKFVSTNNPIEGKLGELQQQLFLDLYFFRYKSGDQFKINDHVFAITDSIREERYDELQAFLNENNKERSESVHSILEKAYKTYNATVE